MTRSAVRTAILAAALLALARTGPAQPQPRAADLPPVVALLPYVGGDDLQKELKLTDEQKTKLLARRQAVWDEVWTTAPKSADLAARNKATVAAFKEILSAEQYARAEQLAARVLWAGPQFGLGSPFGPVVAPAPNPNVAVAYVLAQYPELAAKLELDDTQKKIVASGSRGGFGPGGTSVYLTPDQADRAAKLLGAEFKGKLVAQNDTRLGRAPFGGTFGDFGGFGGPIGRQPLALRYLAAKDVQKDLNLTDEQVKAVAALRAKTTAPTAFVNQRETSPADRKTKDDAAQAELARALDTLLTADQRKRLRQIELQTGPPGAQFLTTSALGKELGVTDAQRKQYDEVTATYADAVAKAALSGKPVAAVEEAVEAAQKEYADNTERVLTVAQRNKRTELLGRDFTGSTLDRNEFGGPRSVSPAKATFGRYTNQLTTLARSPGLHKELKLTDEQVKKVSEARAEFLRRFPTADLRAAAGDDAKLDKLHADRSAHIEKTLADVLTKEQAARFRELDIQYRESPQFGPFGPTAVSLPGVADAVQLTAEQKKKLFDGTPAADVLTAEQKKKVTELGGKPVDVVAVFNAGFNSPNAPGARLTAQQTMLLSADIWEALKLSREQQGKLASALNEYTAATPQRGFGMPPDAKDVAKVIATLGAQIDAILTAKQRDRLAQLTYQEGLLNGLDVALVVDSAGDLAAKLGLTEEQKKAVISAGDYTARVADALLKTTLPDDREQALRLKMRDQLDERLLKELTEAQRAKLKELTGEPHKGFVKPPYYGGTGPGGGGVGGGFRP